jgi:hypothetical protein
VERSLRLRSDCALRCSSVTRRTQSNGAAFSDPKGTEIDSLVKNENDGVKPLVEPPDFRLLLKAVADQLGLDIEVTYAPSAAPKATAPAETPEGEGQDDESENKDADE